VFILVPCHCSIGVLVSDRKRRVEATVAVLVVLLAGFGQQADGQSRPSVPDTLRKGFENPPASARLRCYWWWLNGHTTRATITRDLEEMQKKGYGGVLLVDANGANQNGNDNVPAGPEFGSPEWTALYVHALKEANRLGLEVTLNITSGWNLGGPWVQPEQASKLLTWSRTVVRANAKDLVRIEMPPVKNGFYRQIAVLAYPLHRGSPLAGESGDARKGLTALKAKSAAAEMGFSMPDASSLLVDSSPDKKEEDTELAEIHDITEKIDPDGSMRWSPPAGAAQTWEVLRIGYTDSDARVSTSSGTWQGLAIDYLDPATLDTYWKKSVLPLLEAGKPYVGKSLKYVASDSWELGGTNWTGKFREEFKRRRGYDPAPYLPVVAGRIVGSRELSIMFLADLRRTVADLVNGHYDRMAVLAAEFGLGIQCESGGPHGAPIDALETFRSSSIPQTEYWAMSPEHRSADTERYFVKEASSASHIYGRPLIAAEGMTSIGNQWNESLGMNLRPSFDQALTEGMNRLVWHEFTSSPAELGLPGQEYFAGTHLNPNVTWWRDADSFFMYLNRSQFLLQQGVPVSDVLYYYGDNVPNFVRLKRDDPAKVLPGYDYDVTSTDALQHRISIANGVLQTREGIRYRALALPHSRILPLAVLKLAQEYLRNGGILIGERPLRSQGIVPPEEARQFDAIADELWASCEKKADRHIAIGRGQLFCAVSSRDALTAMGILPDMEEFRGSNEATLDYVHRRTGQMEIYFIRNMLDKPIETAVLLRVRGRQPEIFHADTGNVEASLLFSATSDGRTMVPLSLGARESVFIIFRHNAVLQNVTTLERDGSILYSADRTKKTNLPHDTRIQSNGTKLLLSTPDPGNYRLTLADGNTSVAATSVAHVTEVPGPWTLSFPPGWGAPPQVEMNSLSSWTASPDAGVRYFSGRATYRTTLRLTEEQAIAASSAVLNLGEVHEVAVVRVNGKTTETLWKAPYSVRIDRLLHAGTNTIEIDVTNLWPNRLIGDAQDPNSKHYTWTNIRKYQKDSPLLPSGILGPVTIKPVYNLLLSIPAKTSPKHATITAKGNN
jgi:alpha-L-rhamnosidase